MRHWRIWLYLVGMIAILYSCAVVSSPAYRVSQLAAPTQQIEATSVSEAQVASVAPTDKPTAPAVEEPTTEPTETEIAVVDQVDQCVECHTDKAQLIDTATPEEEVVAESEGAG